MLIATLNPQPDVRPSVRKLPEPKPVAAPLLVTPAATAVTPVIVVPAPEPPPAVTAAVASAPVPRPVVVRPLAPQRYKLQVTISAETRAKLRRAQDLLRRNNHGEDEAAIIDRALTILVEQLEKSKYGRTERPRAAGAGDPGSRHIPAHVRRKVSDRDGDRCAFKGSEGRCPETSGLEYHHRIRFADGGPTTVDNLELRCRAHNVYEEEQWFGLSYARERCDETRTWSGAGPS
jgi:hypothetical protein